MNNYYYKVAGHNFRLSFINQNIDSIVLSNLSPFMINKEENDYLFHLTITDELLPESETEFVGHFDDDIASISVYRNKDGGFRFNITYPGREDKCTLLVDKNFTRAIAQLPDSLHYFHLNNCLMLLYAFSTANKDTLLIHASVIRNKENGFIFLGKSGTGKSTHSQLWLDHIEDSELLNDDNPIIRITDDIAYIFGSPWSGKTACYKNESAFLKGILKLRQAPENKIARLSTLQAYANILPACSCMRWENEVMQGIHNTVEKLATTIGCHHLDCLPDKDAALLSYNILNK